MSINRSQLALREERDMHITSTVDVPAMQGIYNRVQLEHGHRC